MAKKLIHFTGYDFVPNLNPTEMLQLGVHGGKLRNPGQKYDPNMNHFKVYPADINKNVLGHPASRVVITQNFWNWYKGFYKGDRHHKQDAEMIKNHKLLITWAYHQIDQMLGHNELTQAKKYGQLLMELAMNPGFSPTL